MKVLTGSALVVLGALSSAALAEGPIALTDAQMDVVTAGGSVSAGLDEGAESVEGALASLGSDLEEDLTSLSESGLKRAIGRRQTVRVVQDQAVDGGQDGTVHEVQSQTVDLVGQDGTVTVRANQSQTVRVKQSK